MNEPADRIIPSGGHSRAPSDDVSMNGAIPMPSIPPSINGGTTESSTDSGFTGQGLMPLPNPTGAVRRRALQPTGVCYDDRMKLHMNVDWSSHDHHPEDPRRIEEIFNTFKENGLVYSGDPAEIPRILQDAPNKYMYRIAVREATREEICLAHTEEHYDWVKKLPKMSYHELRVLTKIKDQGRDSLYVSTLSQKAALLAAGGAIEVAKHVVAGVLKNGFAIIRPPGHHAEQGHAMGFCFFNNVPVAARVCQAAFPDDCRKVMVLDWDVHHGNGVQNIFYDDPNVLYVSLHVYQNGLFYPGRPEDPNVADGGIENCGSGPGLGKNVNIGWHDQGMGDGEYMAAFQDIVMPIAQEFNPDLVIISAGFDAAKGDELGGCFVTPACYAHMTHMLMSLANGKVAVCLEGGYNLKAISQSALAVAHTLMGEPPPRMDLPAVSMDAQRMLKRVQAYQAPHWECMRKGVVAATDLRGLEITRLHDVIRDSQLRQLLRRHRMTPLHIQKEALSKTFESQVLVTPGILQARRLLIIIHDPPQIVGQLDIDNTLDSHNAFMVDEVVNYIDWAVENKFAVMDVNVPSYEESDNENEPFISRIAERSLETRVQELMCYLWDNYIQLYSEAEIFLLGVGNAHVAIKALLTCRDSTERISGIVNFVTESLKAVKSDIYPDLSSWYRSNSRVYVGDDHVCWQDQELSRRVAKKRFGHVMHSRVSGLGRMMSEHAEDVHEWVLNRVGESGDTTEDETMERS